MAPRRLHVQWLSSLLNVGADWPDIRFHPIFVAFQFLIVPLVGGATVASTSDFSTPARVTGAAVAALTVGGGGYAAYRILHNGQPRPSRPHPPRSTPMVIANGEVIPAILLSPTLHSAPELMASDDESAEATEPGPM